MTNNNPKKLIPVKGSLGISSSTHFYCETCLATFDTGWSRPYTVRCFDTSKCMFCECTEKQPTAKITSEQLAEKKEQIKSRLTIERKIK